MSNLPLKLIDPFPGWLMQRVRATGHVIEKEGVRRGCVQIAHVSDSVVRHIAREVVVGLTDPGEHLGCISKMVGRHWVVSPPMNP